MNQFRIFILLINLLSISLFVNCDTLRAVFVVHRHGDRTPVSTYKNDPYIDDKYWPDGWGELTSRGKKRMFEVGEYLRQRYKSFFSDSIREVQVRSSDKDRCIESTQLIVNGAYKPKGRWVWNSEILFNPVSVHTVPNLQDSMLYPAAKCQAASSELARIFASNYVKNINKKYENLYKYLTANCGEPIQDVIRVSYIYDSLILELIANYTIPVWAKPSVLKQMSELNVISFELMGFTRRIQRFRSGIFLDDLNQKIDAIIHQRKNKKIKNFDESPKKLFVYSSHDSFLTVLLAGLQINNGLPPPFGATIIFELHQHDKTLSNNETHSIKIFYLNETETNHSYQFKVPTCEGEEICTIKQFISSIADITVNQSNWNQECKDNTLLKETLQMGSAIALIILSIVFIPMVLFKTISTYKKKNKQIVYELLPVA